MNRSTCKILYVFIKNLLQQFVIVKSLMSKKDSGYNRSDSVVSSQQKLREPVLITMDVTYFTVSSTNLIML